MRAPHRPGDRLLRRVVGTIGWVGSGGRAREPNDYPGQVLTDKACRMADGSRGLVAIRQVHGQWVEVCVPVDAGR